MRKFNILILIVGILILSYILIAIIYSIRKKKYQKLWNKEKAMRIRIDPNISKGELCDQYVMFCKRNDCNVEF